MVETDESVLDNLSAAESTGEMGYSGLVTPSPPLSLDTHSPASASAVEDEDSVYPRIAHVQSVNIKVEPLDDNFFEDPDKVCMREALVMYVHCLVNSSSDLISTSKRSKEPPFSQTHCSSFVVHIVSHAKAPTVATLISISNSLQNHCKMKGVIATQPKYQKDRLLAEFTMQRFSKQEPSSLRCSRNSSGCLKFLL